MPRLARGRAAKSRGAAPVPPRPPMHPTLRQKGRVRDVVAASVREEPRAPMPPRPCRRVAPVMAGRALPGRPRAVPAREVRAFLSAAARESRRDAGEASSEGSGQGAGRTRRRHRSASAPRAEARGDAAKQAPQKPDVPSVASQVADGDVKVSRRRPGDGGGARRNGVAGQERPKADAARDDAAAGEGQAPKKRRRRRPRKPKGSAPGSQPPVSED